MSFKPSSRLGKYIFLLFFLFFFAGVFAALFAWAKTTFINGIWMGVVAGGIYSLTIGTLIIILDVMFTWKLPKEAFNVCQQRRIVIKENIDAVLQKCDGVLRGDKKIKWIEQVVNKKSIIAATKMTLFSFGEELMFEFVSIDAGQATEIKISSRPRIYVPWIPILDYGKNFRNVENYSNRLNN